MTEQTVEVVLPKGSVTLPLRWDRAASARAVMVLAHGAGAGPDHPFLVGFAAAVRDAGVSVVRFPFAYIVAGRRMPGPVSHAEAAWAAVHAAASADAGGVPVIAAGKSYGGRMASVAAASGMISPTALVYLGYPLHPPGQPDRQRASHLPVIAAPQLFVSGRADPFVAPTGDLERVVASCADADLLWLDGGHSFETTGTRRDPEAVGASLAEPVLARLAL